MTENKKVLKIKTRRILEGLVYRIYLFFLLENDREWTLMKHWDETKRRETALFEQSGE